MRVLRFRHTPGTRPWADKEECHLTEALRERCYCIPILHTGTLRLREVMRLAQSLSLRKKWGQDQNPGCWNSQTPYDMLSQMGRTPKQGNPSSAPKRPQLSETEAKACSLNPGSKSTYIPSPPWTPVFSPPAPHPTHQRGPGPLPSQTPSFIRSFGISGQLGLCPMLAPLVPKRICPLLTKLKIEPSTHTQDSCRIMCNFGGERGLRYFGRD